MSIKIFNVSSHLDDSLARGLRFLYSTSYLYQHPYRGTEYPLSNRMAANNGNHFDDKKLHEVLKYNCTLYSLAYSHLTRKKA